MTEAEFFARKRQQMVERQIKQRGITDKRLIEALLEVPREVFVPDRFSVSAYDDTPLPIPAGQTISQPYVVALMISSLDVSSGDRVLEVGSGSGYAAAILGRLAGEVHALERHRDLVAYASERLAQLAYDNVHVHHSDGTLGWPPAAPFDAIMVSASGPDIPSALRRQLAQGGRLIMPVGRARRLQTLVRLTRMGPDDYRQKDLGGVRFVPLIGEQGW